MKKVTLCATFVVVSVLTLNLSTSKYSKTSDITLKSLIAIPKAEAEEGGKWDVFYGMVNMLVRQQETIVAQIGIVHSTYY